MIVNVKVSIWVDHIPNVVASWSKGGFERLRQHDKPVNAIHVTDFDRLSSRPVHAWLDMKCSQQPRDLDGQPVTSDVSARTSSPTKPKSNI